MAISLNLDAVSEAIRRGWRRLGQRHQVSSRWRLPASAVITKKIILPAGLRDQELEVQVESEANQYIPFALDEVNLDFQVIGPAASNAEEDEVLIAASRKEKVEDRVAAAEAAGLKALVMDVESYAALSAFELVQAQLAGSGRGQDHRPRGRRRQCDERVGAAQRRIRSMPGSRPFGGFLLTQDIMRHFGMSLEEAESGKRTGSLPESYESELLRPFMDALALEVSRALQFFFTSTQFNQVDHIVLPVAARSSQALPKPWQAGPRWTLWSPTRLRT